jgi:hypothetical protein
MRRNGWLGFDGRIFLSEAEYATYRRRLPVRYSARNANPSNGRCEICGLEASGGNPLQAAHKVPFNIGILKYGFTPDWLDGPDNLSWAHRVRCNRCVEWIVAQIDALVANLRAHGHVRPVHRGLETP